MAVLNCFYYVRIEIFYRDLLILMLWSSNLNSLYREGRFYFRLLNLLLHLQKVSLWWKLPQYFLRWNLFELIYLMLIRILHKLDYILLLLAQKASTVWLDLIVNFEPLQINNRPGPHRFLLPMVLALL